MVDVVVRSAVIGMGVFLYVKGVHFMFDINTKGYAHTQSVFKHTHTHTHSLSILLNEQTNLTSRFKVVSQPSFLAGQPQPPPLIHSVTPPPHLFHHHQDRITQTLELEPH
ncbi:hypothetical protein L1987_06000 [Smallanthus sonchifolius]|uniref:Uncharacterized protein n=1 Tax=Smallanthus sonchifolius TaxID=185202 RepID=A0ACB9JX60_9ASTR|nr:hypothetical protein L1987_06000 [Smallanthus sonchifolius]